MQFFLPSVLVLLAAAAVVFFVLPRWGPFVLAIISALLLIMGVYHHSSTFASEYRLATWHLGLISYAPYIMVSGLLIAIAIYLVFLIPTSVASEAASTNASLLPTIAEMPSANTATNGITGAINRALNTAANVVSVNKKNNSGGLLNTVLGNNKRNNKGLNFPFSQV